MSASTTIIRHENSLGLLLKRLGDAKSIAVAFYVATLYPTLALDASYVAAAAVAIVLFQVLAEMTGLYRSWRGVAADREVGCTLLTWGHTLVLLLVLGFLSKFTAEFSRAAVLIIATTGGVLLCAWRVLLSVALRWLRASGVSTKRFAIVGVNELGIRLARDLKQSPQFGLDLHGFYDDRPIQRTGELPADAGARVGDIAELVQAAKRREIDRIYITFPMRAEERIRGVLEQLADTTASVYIVPDFFVFELLHSRWTDINGLPAVSVFENPFFGVDGVLKRVLDVVLASVLLILLAIPLMIVAALIAWDSPGPILFRQRRYGLDGRSFWVWKFRTMRVCEDGPVVKQATRSDPRVTRLGAILRRTSIDELPQLFNVLMGTMSLVGPRPHANAHNEQYRKIIPGYMLRHKVKPGITGLAQVNGWRGETDTLEKMQRRVECDHRYIRDWSLWLDLSILVRTAWVVFGSRNAY